MFGTATHTPTTIPTTTYTPTATSTPTATLTPVDCDVNLCMFLSVVLRSE